MQVSEDGVAIPELIETVKQAIKTANISSNDLNRELRVGSVRLTLNAVATRSVGGGVEFRIPFIGMQIKVGSKLTRRDTHQIDINLVPPDLKGRPELRDGDLGSVFVDAINTIRAAVASAATGDDPFVLTESSVNISFAITAEGIISLGVDGELANQLTHTLTLGLIPA
ncbi:MAG: trypco2 family protein [Streptosporangiaceae bacterium]